MTINNLHEPRKYRIRRCDGNRAAWMLVLLKDDGSEGEMHGTYTTAMSLDALLKWKATCAPTSGDTIELVIP